MSSIFVSWMPRLPFIVDSKVFIPSWYEKKPIVLVLAA
ncbi:hypothetical protein DB29_01142 [Shouchella clausii]|nr:hypothetical protein DB29_01142 [Shouchella clausii]